MMRAASIFAVLLLGVSLPAAAQLQVPAEVAANSGFEIPTSGSGSAVFYLVGPGSAVKRAVTLGEPIVVDPEEVRHAGGYTAVLKGGGSTQTANFQVTASRPARLSFIVKPSRLPVAVPEAISGVTYVFDAFQNLILKPQQVAFRLELDGAAPVTRTVPTRLGAAWVRLDSGRKEGLAEFTVSLGDVSERRIVQQVASHACNLRIRARRGERGVLVETEPVRDCSGNPVPDGTIVTFSSAHPRGVSTVDAPIKKGVARAELPAHRGAVISAASGVVMGNEIRWGGGQ